jgi:hypothetical protein
MVCGEQLAEDQRLPTPGAIVEHMAGHGIDFRKLPVVPTGSDVTETPGVQHQVVKVEYRDGDKPVLYVIRSIERETLGHTSH